MLKGEKKVFKVTEVRQIIIPKLEELSVKNILNQAKNDVNIKEYFPDEYFKKLAPDRTFFFNTINTIYPGYLPALVCGANR